MRDVFKIWISHRTIWLYFGIVAVLAGTLIARGIWLQHGYLALLLFLAPFYEWLVHKFFLHMEMNSKTPAMQKYLDKIHVGHHRHPRDKELVFAPFLIGIQVPLSFFLLPLLVGGSLDQALTLALFVQLYYLYYEWIHLAHHTESYRPLTKWGLTLRQSHTWHHYKNENFWWGVTSVLGDMALGTYPHPNDVDNSPTVRDLHGH